jgi:hypothetical protein
MIDPASVEADHPWHRFREAYLRMANEARYRPQAPSDGCGNIQLTPEEYQDPDRLEQEASAYATRFLKEENTLKFGIGCSDYQTNRAFMFAIEAARLLAGGLGSEPYAIKLLKLAIEDVEREMSRTKKT